MSGLWLVWSYVKTWHGFFWQTKGMKKDWWKLSEEKVSDKHLTKTSNNYRRAWSIISTRHYGQHIFIDPFYLIGRVVYWYHISHIPELILICVCVGTQCVVSVGREEKNTRPM